MGTRGIIGVAHDGGFTGHYRHSDSYPSGVAPELLQMYRSLGSAEAVIERVVTRPREEDGLVEPDFEVTNEDDCGAEWAYLLDERGVHIVAAMRADGRKAVGMFGSIGDIIWESITTVSWDDEKPDWERIECGDDLARCVHYAWRHFPEAEGLSIGTDVWLGRRPPGSDDITALIARATGKRIELAGGGSLGTATDPYGHDVLFRNPRLARYWWVQVKGSREDVRAFRVLKSGYKLEPGWMGTVTIASGEVLIPAGTVMQ